MNWLLKLPFIRIAMAGLCALIIGGFLGFIHPALDTMANFRIHLILLLLLLATYCYRASRAIIVLVMLLITSVGFYVGFGGNIYGFHTEPNSSNAKQYQLLQFNLYYANETPQKFIDLVHKANPDILTLNEVSRNWKTPLLALKADYPFVHHCPEWKNIGGTVIYSRFPMQSGSDYCHDYAALALKDVVIDGKTVTIGAVHLRWPWPASGPRQVDKLQSVLGRLGPDALIAGDFNSTPWTWLVRRFAKYGNLQIVSYAGASWIHRLAPTSLASSFGLALDNAMSKGNVKVINAQTLKPVGSDHLPLLVRFIVE